MLKHERILLMKKFISSMVLGSAVCLSAAALLAQAPMGGSVTSGNFSAGMRKLFGENKAFSAQMAMQVLDKSAKETLSATMNFSMLDGKVRTEVDMGAMKSSQMPAGMSDQLKQMGMDKVVSIMRPDKKIMYIVYPTLKSYVEMPLPAAEQESLTKEVKIEKTEQGKETIDGHPCTKSKVIMTDDTGRKQEGLVWTAKDLKEFPIKMQFTEQENTFVMTYTSIKFDKPAESQFEGPSDFTKHDSMQTMMQGVTQKMMQQQQGGGQK
jgi:hypothetical protein